MFTHLVKPGLSIDGISVSPWYVLHHMSRPRWLSHLQASLHPLLPPELGVMQHSAGSLGERSKERGESRDERGERRRDVSVAGLEYGERWQDVSVKEGRRSCVKPLPQSSLPSRLTHRPHYSWVKVVCKDILATLHRLWLVVTVKQSFKETVASSPPTQDKRHIYRSKVRVGGVSLPDTHGFSQSLSHEIFVVWSCGTAFVILNVLFDLCMIRVTLCPALVTDFLFLAKAC